mgnify:CR=1 FL=1
MGLGVAALVTSQKRDRGSGPFDAGAANNGLSVDAVSGKIVLGNNFGDPTEPAQLLNSRKILTNGFAISLHSNAAADNVAFISASEYQLSNNLTFQSWDFQPAVAFADDPTAAVGTPVIALRKQGNAIRMVGTTLGMDYRDNVSVTRITFDMVNRIFTFDGNLKTRAPGGAAGEWRLGKKTAGAVALDATNYVEVLIDGVIVKLLIST